MTATLAPCPVCGRSLAPTTAGRIPYHREPALVGVAGSPSCRGSGALAPAGDLFPDAPTVPALPAPGAQGSLFTDARED